MQCPRPSPGGRRGCGSSDPSGSTAAGPIRLHRSRSQEAGEQQPLLNKDIFKVKNALKEEAEAGLGG